MAAVGEEATVAAGVAAIAAAGVAAMAVASAAGGGAASRDKGQDNGEVLAEGGHSDAGSGVGDVGSAGPVGDTRGSVNNDDAVEVVGSRGATTRSASIAVVGFRCGTEAGTTTAQGTDRGGDDGERGRLRLVKRLAPGFGGSSSAGRSPPKVRRGGEDIDACARVGEIGGHDKVGHQEAALR
ncbi:hypothetical protein I4F81_001589 [Pyropia yezoensis]|uniref:Uncharacterized protein n=1 Tax=Pyropia yezoensis TaxID=2788 RepID=A0ACC3BM02_PYRYE|nr:hypothetical protein I4F81_001589 [Neopyropia yezoensis]